jgi:hypothetical protein
LRWMREPIHAAPRRPARSAWLAWSVAAVAVGIVLWIALTRPAPARPVVTRATISLGGAPPLALGRYTTAVGFFSPLLALSHDGSRLLYVGVVDGGTQLFMRRLDSFEVKPVDGTRGAYHGFFSPDDRWIGFFTNGKVMKVPAGGGTPVTLSSTVAAVRGVWTNSGILVISEHQGQVVREVPENGGPGKIIEIPLSGGPVRFSGLLPDGTLMLASRHRLSGDFSGCVLFDRKTQRFIPLLDGGYDVRAVGDSRLVFVRGGDLLTIAFDAKSRKVIGEAVLLQSGVATDSFFRQAQFAVSEDGTVAFIPGVDRAVGQFAFVDTNGRTDFLPFPKRAYVVFSISPDGQKIATDVADVDDFISILDIRNGVEKRMPLPADSRFPVWMGDSKTLVYATLAAIEASDMAGNRRVVVDAGFAIPSVSADGRTLVAQRRRTSENPATIISLGSKPEFHTINHGHCLCDVSPDGKWVAYLSDRSGRDEVWVSRVDDLQESEQVSTGGGVEPRFCAACPDLFYRDGTRWYAVRRGPDGDWQPPVQRFDTEFVDTIGRSYDVTPDGNRLLISKAVPDITDRIGVLQHAFDR